MKTAIKKPPFAEYLDGFVRSKLSFVGALPKNREGKLVGITIEDFVAESRARGVNVQVGTVYPWRQGAMPRPTKQSDLRAAFPDIIF